MGGWSRVRRSWDYLRAQWATADRIAALGEERRRVAAVLAIAEATWATPTADGHRLGFEFAPDERELLGLPAVELVEAPWEFESSRSGYPEADNVGTQVAWMTEVVEKATSVGAGQAWITTHRLMFQGPQHARAWSFGDLAEINVAKGAPLLYLHHKTRRRTAGLRIPAHRFDEVLDHLQVALAAARGEDDALVQSLRHRLQALDERLREHAREVPGASPAVRPGGPGPSEWARRGWQFFWKPADGPWLPAGIGRRTVACALDGLLFVVMPLIGMWGFFLASGVGPGLEAGIDITRADFAQTDLARWLRVTGLTVGGIFIVVEALFYAKAGATPGKRRMGMMVIDVRTGQPPSFTRALVRSGAVFAISFGYTAMAIDVLFLLLHPQRHALHDRVSRTAVVRHL